MTPRSHAVLRFLSRDRAVILITAAGIALRLLLLALAADSPLRNDQKNYHDVALLLLGGESFSPNWPPGLPYYLSSVHALLGAGEVVSRIAMLLLYIPFSLLLAGLAGKLAGSRAASVAALLFAFSPAFVFHSIEPLTQLPVTVCLLAMMAAMLSQLRAPALWKLAALGLCAAGALLVRPSAGIIALAAAGYLAWKQRSVAAAVVPLAVLAFVVGAWMLKAGEMGGHGAVINYNNARNFFYGNNPHTPLYRTWWFGSHVAGDEDVPAAYTALITAIDARPIHERDSVFTALAWEHILGRPDLFLLRTVNRARCFFAYDTFTGSFLYKWYPLPRAVGLAAIALDAALYAGIVILALLFFAMKGRGTNAGAFTIIALAIPLLYALPYVVSFSHPTYHFPVLPFLALFAVAALERTGYSVRALREAVATLPPGRKRVFGIAVLLFVVVQIEWTVMMIGRV
ncbi:MAG: glycosyltransferase family 39 protein [Ignavibacteria bacterium]|nr:glycosyltransferase family 39 protein [Ignavibacteria bacterium]